MAAAQCSGAVSRLGKEEIRRLVTHGTGHSVAHDSLSHVSVSSRRRQGSVRCAVSSEGTPGSQSPFQSSSLFNPSSLGLSSAAKPGNQQPYLPFLRPERPAAASLSVDEMLEVLRDRRGLWYEYAPYITALTRQGLGPNVIAEITGIEGSEQNTLVVAGQVHGTLKDLGCQALPYFDIRGAEILYELRILSANRRKDAAEYVASKYLDGQRARELAKAMKDYERRTREEGWNSFSRSPADCMAFEYYRQGREARSKDEKVTLLEHALEYAETELAREKVRSALARIVEPEIVPATVDDSLARVPTVRLRMDETFPKPIPVVGSLLRLSPGAFWEVSQAVSLVRMEGPFEIFSPSNSSMWMAVPAWPAVMSVSGLLLGVLVEDPGAVPEFRSRNLTEPMVLLVEASSASDAADESGKGLFLCAQGDDVVVSPVPEGVLGRIVVAVLAPKPGEELEYSLDD